MVKKKNFVVQSFSWIVKGRIMLLYISVWSIPDLKPPEINGKIQVIYGFLIFPFNFISFLYLFLLFFTASIIQAEDMGKNNESFSHTDWALDIIPGIFTHLTSLGLLF